jgi:DNA ligase-1
MTFKPMLAPNDKVNLAQINYPYLASKKLDGIRCIFVNGLMLSRKFKPIPNKKLHERFDALKKFTAYHKIILDGEIYGEGLTFQQITHFVMSKDTGFEEIPEELKFHCFDMIEAMNFATHFEIRNDNIEGALNGIPRHTYEIVEQVKVNSKEEVEKLFEDVLAKGYEGLILKSPTSHYKCGRGTMNEGLIYKVKPFETFDAEIIGVEERMENTSESYTNELGKSQKHNFKDAMRPTGIAAAFVVMYNGEEQKVSLTGDMIFRKDIWQNKEKYIGKMIEYKGMLVGSKDKVRHPVFVRFREDIY